MTAAGDERGSLDEASTRGAAGIQVGDYNVQVNIFAGRSTAAVARNTLPRDTSLFTGRADELAELSRSLTASARAQSVVAIHGIDGMPGIGKTAFAVHAAHQLLPLFPDGQFFISLHAHSLGQGPVRPTDALGALLRIDGVDSGQIPADGAARTALWRDRMAGRKALIVLDDALDEDQVTPLIPGGPDVLVLITSRRRLTGMDDLVPISLGTLTPADACDLFVRISARSDLTASSPEVATLVRRCGYLPLAIRLQAGRLRHHPLWDLRELAAGFEGTGRPVFDSFRLSLYELDPALQRLFRLVSLYPGPGIDVAATAAIAAVTTDTARTGLEVLYERHFLEEVSPLGFDLHDLMREYGQQQAAEAESPDSLRSVIERIIEFHVTMMGAAAVILHPPRRGATQPRRKDSNFTSYDQALAWCDDKRKALVATVTMAAEHDRHAAACELAVSLRAYLGLGKHWDDWLRTHTIALASARMLGDCQREARILRQLAYLCYDLGRLDEALRHCTDALQISQDTGNQDAETSCLLILGQVHWARCEYQRSLDCYGGALERYEARKDQLGAGHALNGVGESLRCLGRYDLALEHFHRALDLAVRFDDLRAQAAISHNIGQAYQGKKDWVAAEESLALALAARRDLKDVGGVARSLDVLGEVMLASGRLPEARAYWAEELDLLDKLGAPGARALAERISALDRPG